MKRKVGGEDDEGPGGSRKLRINYTSADRLYTGGEHYRDCTIAALQSAFPLVPLSYLRKKLTNSNGLYAPMYLEIWNEEEMVEKAGGVGRLYKRKKAAGTHGAGEGRYGRDVRGE